MHITEKTKEYECCCSCKHNKRKSDEKGIYCECEIDGHYIGYIECFDSVCERWKKNNMDYETLRKSMTIQDAARVLKETNCYGTMDIAKNVILKALDEQPRWIATSERLPEKDTYVLATTRWEEITIAEMYSENDWFIHEGATNVETDEIIAWMPMPEPYKESEDKK